MYRFDPNSGEIRHLGDLTEICGEKGLKAIPQGKVHTSFAESGGKLFFATDVGYVGVHDNRGNNNPPPGYRRYPGGHFLSYDIAFGKFEDLGVAVPGEGVMAMAMDTKRERLYGLTWPSGYLVRYDLLSKALRNLGRVQLGGETWPAPGPAYRTICRSLAVDPDDGNVYFTRADGAILSYRYDSDTVGIVDAASLRKDYFGSYDPSSPDTMGYNWRQAVWYPPEKAIYGVHGNSGYLLRFDPRFRTVEVIERITSKASQASGMYDRFEFGYLGFTLGPDGHTLFYLTGGPIAAAEKRPPRPAAAGNEADDEEDFHLVTYDIQSREYADHGAIFLQDGQRPAAVNSIAVGKDGAVYTLGRIAENLQRRTDLIRVEYR